MKIVNCFLFTSSLALGLVSASTDGDINHLPWWRARPNLLQIAGVPYPTRFDFDYSKGRASVDAVLKGMVDSGITVLDLHTAYNSGDPVNYSGDGCIGNEPYDVYSCLFHGLAISVLKSVNPFYESRKGKGDAAKNLKYLIKTAQKRNKKVVSWMNLSYFHTLSPLRITIMMRVNQTRHPLMW